MSNNCKHAESEGGGSGGGVRLTLHGVGELKMKEFGGSSADPC